MSVSIGQLDCIHVVCMQSPSNAVACRMKDVNKHAPKELKAYADCIDSHGCGDCSSADLTGRPDRQLGQLRCTYLMLLVACVALFCHTQ